MDEAAAWLVRAGLDRATARALLALADGEELATPDLERRAGLRQADASLATLRLRARGWAALRTEPTGARGRPLQRFALKVTFDEALDALAAAGADADAIAALRKWRDIQKGLSGTGHGPTNTRTSHEHTNDEKT